MLTFPPGKDLMVQITAFCSGAYLQWPEQNLDQPSKIDDRFDIMISFTEEVSEPTDSGLELG